MPALPQPRTDTDDYLAAIHGVLVEIRDRLPERKQESKPGATKVTEPARAPAKRTTQRRSA